MAKDDYDVLVFKILTYLYGVMQRKAFFSKEGLNKLFPEDIPEEYLLDIFRLMTASGLIEGLTFVLNDTLKMVYHSTENAYDILTDVEEKNLDSCDITIPYTELKKGIRYPILFDALKNQCRFVFTGWTEGKFYRSEVFHNVFDNVYMDADKLNMMSANIYNCNYIMENIEID